MASIRKIHASAAEEWAALVEQEWRKTVEGILNTGRVVNEALDDLEHGEKAGFYKRLPFSMSTAKKLGAVAKDPRFLAHVRDLPASWGTLYELTKLDNGTWTNAIKNGLIRADMERCDAKRLRPPAPIVREEIRTAKSGHEWAMGLDELLPKTLPFRREVFDAAVAGVRDHLDEIDPGTLHAWKGCAKELQRALDVLDDLTSGVGVVDIRNSEEPMVHRRETQADGIPLAQSENRVVPFRREVRHRIPHNDPDRFVEATVSSLENLVSGFSLCDSGVVKIDQIDRSKLKFWTDSMSESLRALTQFRKHLTKLMEEE